MMRTRPLMMLMWLVLCGMQTAAAHELQTVALRLQETADHHITARLNTPLARDGQPATVVPQFDARCSGIGSSRAQREPTRTIREWQLQCQGGLQGLRLRFDGLDPRTPEALVIATFADGTTRTLAVDRHDPNLVITPQTAPAIVGLIDYLPLGIEHILLGPDHLLFVLGLMLIVSVRGGGWRVLLVALTAFTLAHSLTLGLAMFGLWGLPPKPVEILIALSIVLLAVELAQHQHSSHNPTLTLRKPWLVAFAFGLLHGFGFAGALSEIGLPAADRGWALLLFNLGVEVGQLLFVSAVLLLLAAARRLRWQPLLHTRFVTMALGSVAVYWTLDRTALWWQASGLSGGL